MLTDGEDRDQENKDREKKEEESDEHRGLVGVYNSG